MDVTRLAMLRARVRVRNLITAAVLAALAAAFTLPLVAQGHGTATGVATPVVPFRLMEATISETQAALSSGTITSE